MVDKPDAILIGPCYGELFWEFFRFAPYVFKKIKANPKCKIIVCTRRDRYDIYGNHADEFIPLNVKMVGGLFPDCFRMTGLTPEMQELIENELIENVSEDYEIIEHIKPDTSNNQFCNKDQFPIRQRSFFYMPQHNNRNIIEPYLDGRKIVVLAPRYRANFQRNWPYWDELYDMIWLSPLYSKYQFVICGKTGEIVEDEMNRYLDINYIPQENNTSLFGVTMEILKRAFYTIGSQSAIPNISLILGTPVLQWGNQKDLHTKTYNIYDTKVEFIEDSDFNVKSEIVFNQMVDLLEV